MSVDGEAITYTSSLGGIHPATLSGGFFEGWMSAPTPEEHLRVLQAANHVVVARHGHRVVGFVNALSDGLLSAYIPLLEVLPDYRGRGIGSELVRRVREEIGPVYMIDVMCDAGVGCFYERLGFLRVNGAVRRNYGWRTAGR